MYKVVLDTNVIISAFLTPAGPSATILRLVLHKDLEICSSTAILAEYEQVLTRPKFTEHLQNHAIQRFMDILHDMATEIICLPSTFEMPDESDRIFYDTAKEAGAFLITGNKKHFPAETMIVSPTEFIKIFSTQAE